VIVLLGCRYAAAVLPLRCRLLMAGSSKEGLLHSPETRRRFAMTNLGCHSRKKGTKRCGVT